ncbi:hypothetical protein ACFXAZ_28915 [Streptomyces sp. NPDC059477]|uniref:hypothetical protein n=1 Tax=Streptomyces sp. NPDC059477 TaxID=3346847 RepID=UPI0036BA0C5F
MRKRLVRKMFREMAGGRTVFLRMRMVTYATMARLAFYAEQFGYRYADASYDQEFLLILVPDSSAEGQARAAANWARYPQAASGGELPALVDKDIRLFRMRIDWDMYKQYSPWQRSLYILLGLTPLCAIYIYAFRDNVAVVAGVGGFWVLTVGLGVFGLVWTPRLWARREERMRAAGLMGVTDAQGRLRYVPDDGLPGEGNPFATRSAGA